MRYALILLLLLLPVVAAEDIELTAKGEPLGTIEVSPGEKLDIGIKVSKGVLIKDVQIETKSAFIKQIFENNLRKSYSRQPQDRILTKQVILPSTMPKLDDDVKIKLIYSDASMEDKSMDDSVHISSPKGSAIVGALVNMLSDDATAEITNWLTGHQVERLNKDLTLDDLNKKDLESLGITPEQVLSGEQVPEIELIGDKSDIQKDKESNNFNGLKGDVYPAVEVTVKTFKVFVGDKEIIKSKITLSIKDEVGHKLGSSNLQLIVDIPKEVAQTASELGVSELMEIIKEDPVIKWSMKNLPQNHVKDFSFTTDGNAQNFEVLAKAAADKPSMMGRFVAWIVGFFK